MKHAMMDDSDDAAWGWHRAISPGLKDTLLRSDLVFFFFMNPISYRNAGGGPFSCTEE